MHMLLCNTLRLLRLPTQVNRPPWHFCVTYPYASVQISRTLVTCLAPAPHAPSSSFNCANFVEWSESVAQLVEHRPFKALVLGSSPSALTIIPSIYFTANSIFAITQPDSSRESRPPALR